MGAGAAASSPGCLPKLGWAAEPLCGLRPPPPTLPCSSQERSLVSARFDGGGEAQSSTISRGGLYEVQHILRGATPSALFLWKLRPKEEEFWSPVTQQSMGWTGPGPWPSMLLVLPWQLSLHSRMPPRQGADWSFPDTSKGREGGGISKGVTRGEGLGCGELVAGTERNIQREGLRANEQMVRSGRSRQS